MPLNNVCDCDNPPGGQIVCEPHQMAICGVINGVIRRECSDPPSVESRGGLTFWALSQISGEGIRAYSGINEKELLTLLLGKFTAPSGEVVNFNIPRYIAEEVHDILREVWKSGEWDSMSY